MTKHLKPPPETGRVFVYCRVSTVEQGKEKPNASQGYGIEAQKKMALDKIAYKLPHCKLACDPLVDIGVSGKTPMWRRKQGSILFEQLQKGDHLVIARMDRAFRNSLDFLNTVKMLKEMGVFLHFCDIELDPQSPIGMLVLTILAAVAQFEREMISIRTKEAKANIKGTIHEGRRKYGYTARIGIGGPMPQPLPEEREIGRFIVDLRDNKKLTWYRIGYIIRTKMIGHARRKGPKWDSWRKVIVQGGPDGTDNPPKGPRVKDWYEHRVREAYLREKKAQEEEREREEASDGIIQAGK